MALGGGSRRGCSVSSRGLNLSVPLEAHFFSFVWKGEWAQRSQSYPESHSLDKPGLWGKFYTEPPSFPESPSICFTRAPGQRAKGVRFQKIFFPLRDWGSASAPLRRQLADLSVQGAPPAPSAPRPQPGGGGEDLIQLSAGPGALLT